MQLEHTIQSTMANLILIAGLPYLGYFLFHRLRHKRSLREIALRAGLQLGELKYLGLAASASLLTVVALLLWPLDLSFTTKEGSAMAGFAGQGLTALNILAALIYGVIKTGFCEELLFRGLIAGSLGRRLNLHWANVLQAAIFTAIHLPLLLIDSGIAPLLLLIFFFSLFTGWLRIASGSFFGPWLIHASANVTMCLLIAVRTSPPIS